MDLQCQCYPIVLPLQISHPLILMNSSESVSIPTNPRLHRAAGYAFVDLHTKEEADRAITELSGKEILERKVSVQTARKLTGERRPRGRFYRRKTRRSAKVTIDVL